jgi:acyl-CoA synthetase (NDP forming)
MESKKYETWYGKRLSALGDCWPERISDLKGRSGFADEELKNTIKNLESLPFPEGNGFALVSRDAEYGNACLRFIKNFPKRGFRLFMAELSPQTLERIQRAAPGIPSCRNPIYTGNADGETCAAVIETLLGCEEAGILICQDCFGLPGIKASRARSFTKKILASRKPTIFFGSSESLVPDAVPKSLVSYPGIRDALLAAQLLVEFRNNLEIRMLETVLGPRLSNS